MTVCNDLYLGDEVADGFYNSLKALKTSDVESLEASTAYASFSEDYEHIIENMHIMSVVGSLITR